MDVDDHVWNQWQGILRFGVINGWTDAPDGWRYFSVSWVDDEKYEAAIAQRKRLNGDDISVSLYRADQIHPYQ